MEILLWLVPPLVVTVVAMLWVAWSERAAPPPDREEQVRRIGEALRAPVPQRPGARGGAPRDRSSGVAVRRPHAD